MAEKKVKEEKVRLHNKGKREFMLTGGIKSSPGRAIDVDKSVAEKFIKNYPKDFILYDDLVAPGSTKNELKSVKAENEKLAAESTTLAAENENLKKELEALKAATAKANTPAKAEGAKQTAPAAKGGE